MLFYLFSTETLAELFARLDYPFTGAMIPKNIAYYIARSSHGSTLSGVVDAWVLARSDRLHSWGQFKQALCCDVDDEGGMTAEGVHLGAMAGSADLLQRCYTGLELRDGQLWFNPCLPAELLHLEFRLRYRRNSLLVRITQDALSVSSDASAADPITIRPRRAGLDDRAGRAGHVRDTEMTGSARWSLETRDADRLHQAQAIIHAHDTGDVVGSDPDGRAVVLDWHQPIEGDPALANADLDPAVFGPALVRDLALDAGLDLAVADHRLPLVGWGDELAEQLDEVHSAQQADHDPVAHHG